LSPIAAGQQVHFHRWSRSRARCSQGSHWAAAVFSSVSNSHTSRTSTCTCSKASRTGRSARRWTHERKRSRSSSGKGTA